MSAADPRGGVRSRVVGRSSKQLVTDGILVAAQVVSVMGMAVALGALLFSGPLLDGRAQATTAFAVGAGLTATWLALRSGIVPLAVVPQDAPSVVLVAVVATVLARDPALEIETVMALLAVSTLATGLLMFLLGRLGMGEVVRYLPTVVVHGFIAGTGWLLLRGGFGVALGRPLSMREIDVLFESDQLLRWGPAVLLAVAVYAVGTSETVPTWMASASLVGATGGFYLVAAVVSSIGQVQTDGWLIGPFASDARPALVDPRALADLPRDALGGSIVNLLSLLVVAVVALLLNLSALENIRRERVDTGRELRETGLANVVTSVFGAIPAYHALGDTVLAQRMGVRSRSVLLAAGLVTAGLGIFGAGAVGYVPLFVAGATLMAVGLSLLIDWVVFLVRPIGWVDRLLSVAVVAVITIVGIIQGVLVGLVLASAVLVLRYSRVDAVRRLTDGSVSRGRVDRSPAEAEFLARHDAELRVLGLQGYLFFALATKLTDTLRGLVVDATPVRTVVIDLRLVTGVEPGTAGAMESLWGELADAGVEVLLAGPDPALISIFSGRALHRSFRTLDDALEFVENRLLRAVVDDSADGAAALRAGSALPLEAFERRVLPAGTVLMAAGDPGDTLVFVVDGSFSVMTTAPSGERHRVRHASGPAWLGETGFLRRAPRSADVVADTSVDCAVLDRDGFDRLRTQSPEAAMAILEDIAITAASRTASLTRAVAGLLD